MELQNNNRGQTIKTQLAPVVLFVYNRPQKTRAALLALQNNDLASDTILYIFSDAAKNDSQIANVREVRKIIKQKYKFNKTIILESERNRGLAKSVIYGVSSIISKYGKVIVLEDDLITHSKFLTFMNTSLDFYHNNPKVFSITGYNYPKEKIVVDSDKDVYFFYRQCSWGWATWVDRWNKVDWKMKDYQQFKKNRVQQKKFNEGGGDLSFLLDLQWHHLIDSWAIRWNFSAYKLKAVAVYPVQSLIDNTGFDGSGTHSGVALDLSNNLNYSSKNDWKLPSKVYVDQEIAKNFELLFQIDAISFIKLQITKIFHRKMV